jgi:hypothetical protein
MHVSLAWCGGRSLRFIAFWVACGALVGCGNKAEDSRQNMHKLQLAMIEYATNHDGIWPDRLVQIEDKVGGEAALAKLLTNPLTGDNPGYEYVKPQGKDNDAGFGSQVVLYQIRGGKRDTTLQVGYADGSVRAYEGPSPSPKGSSADWEEFSHPQGKFTVIMPGIPQQFVQEVPSAAGKLKMTINVVELRDQAKAFAVAFADYPPGVDYGDDAIAHKIIDGVIAGGARSRKGVVQKKTKIKLGSHHGQECLLDIAGGDSKSLRRVYLVKNRLYQLFSDWSAKQGDTSADAEKFLNSFKVTD